MINVDVLYSQLTLCGKWTYNVHNDRTYKDRNGHIMIEHIKNIGISKFENT